jgi:hypothetical protein
MSERKMVKIVLSSGETKEAVLSFSRGEPCVVEVDGHGSKVLHAEAGDLFDCLVKIRMDLEMDGAKILCNGARLDAYPSPMARDMGGGRKVYLMRMGEVAQHEDLVGTFDEAPVEKIGSVADQRSFYLSWLKSV